MSAVRFDARSLAALLRTASLVIAASPSLAFAQAVESGSASCEPAPHTIYWGMDAVFVRQRLGNFPGQNQIATPTQSLHISTSISDALRIEAPLSALISNSNIFGWRTQISSGLLLDVFPARFRGGHRSSAQTGFFIGGGALVDYLHYNDAETTYGLTGRAGYELAWDGVHLRVAALYERHFEDEEVFRTRRYGGSVGFSYPLLGDRRVNSDRAGSWYIETRLGLNHQTVGNEAATYLVVPKPFLSVFHFPGSQRRAALGLRTNLQYNGDETFSNRAVQLTPRAEINLFRNSFSRRGIQVGAHARTEHYKTSSSIPGTVTQTHRYYGAGGDISLTLPMMPTMWKLGVGFDHDFAGRDHLRPAFNTLRFDVAVDRYLAGSRKSSDN